MVTRIPFNGSFRISQPYGKINPNLYGSKPHTGVDMVGVSSPTVYATMENGQVVYVGYEKNGFGNYVKVRDNKTGYFHYYPHLKKICVKRWQHVNYTTIIGIMGSTGYSTGVHLHYEIRKSDNKTRIDPCKYMGIPNKAGVYSSNDYAIDGEGDVLKDMTKSEFDKVINNVKAGYENQIEELSRTIDRKISDMQDNILKKISQNENKTPVYRTLDDVPVWYKGAIEECIKENVIVPGKDGIINISEDLARAITIIDRKEADYDTLEQIPEWFRPSIQKLVDMGILKGEQGSGEDLKLNIGTQAIKILVILDRLGIFDKKDGE